MATEDRPSIAELQRIEGAMTVAPWDSGEDPRDDGEVCDPNLKCIAKVRGNMEANTIGIAALRNAAPVLLEIAAAAQAWDAYTGPDRIHKIEVLIAALRKMRP